MTTYPAAYYVPVLDGVAGSLSFVSNIAGSVYQPAGAAYSDVVTGIAQTFAASPAILEIAPAAPTPGGLTGGGANWQTTSGSFAWTYTSSQLVLNFNGSLPSLTAPAPAGWILRERGWQVESVDGTQALSFYDSNDPNTYDGIPDNLHPIFMVPFYGGYTASNGLGVSVGGITVSGQQVSDVTLTLTLPKPLNPNQTLAGMAFYPTSSAGGGMLALPNTPYNLLGNTGITATTNSSGQIVGFVITIPLSHAAQGPEGGGHGQVVPGYGYNFNFLLQETLTYLNGNAFTTGLVTICQGSTILFVPDASAGPNITLATMAAVPGSGVSHFVPPDASYPSGLTQFFGAFTVTFDATDPTGVNSYPSLTFPGVYSTSGSSVTGNGPWVVSCNSANAAFNGLEEPVQLSVSNLDPFGVKTTTVNVSTANGGGIAIYNLAWAADHSTSSVWQPYPVTFTIALPSAFIASVQINADGTYASLVSSGAVTVPALATGAVFSHNSGGFAFTVQNVNDTSTLITLTATGMVNRYTNSSSYTTTVYRGGNIRYVTIWTPPYPYLTTYALTFIAIVTTVLGSQIPIGASASGTFEQTGDDQTSNV